MLMDICVSSLFTILGMRLLHSVIHFLGCFQSAYKSVCVTARAQTALMLLSKLTDDLTEGVDELLEPD
jgi:hypothetical protein